MRFRSFLIDKHIDVRIEGAVPLLHRDRGSCSLDPSGLYLMCLFI